MAKRAGVDKWLFFITVVLIVTGLAMVFSASAVVAQEQHHSPYSIVGKQAICALAGLAALLLLSHIDYSVYNSPRVLYPALCITVFLLGLVYFMPAVNNAHRWINLHGFNIQPSEIAKPVLVLFLAWFLSTRLGQMRDWKNTLLRAAIIPVLFMVLIDRQPDLGTALVLAGVTAMMLVLAGMEWKYLFMGVAAAMPLLAYQLLSGYHRKRMEAFFNPDSDPLGVGFHINQSLIAVGAGGLTGRGYMNGAQKLFFLPEAHNDFIFANIAEELGFVGAIVLLCFFVYFGWRGLRTAFRAPDSFARLAAFGLTTTILLQAFFNISVVIALLPAKGIPLPLISAGGTSIIVTLASIGVLLNISRKAD
jgi:cell division protein FtsW